MINKAALYYLFKLFFLYSVIIGCKSKSMIEIKNETYYSRNDSIFRLEKYFSDDTLISIKTICDDMLVEQINYKNNAIASYYFYSKNGLCYSRIYDENRMHFSEFGSPCYYGYVVNSDRTDRKANTSDTLKFYFFTPNIFDENMVFLNYYDTLHSVFSPVSDIPGLFYTITDPRDEGVYEDCFTIVIKDKTLDKEINRKDCILIEIVNK